MAYTLQSIQKAPSDSAMLSTGALISTKPEEHDPRGWHFLHGVLPCPEIERAGLLKATYSLTSCWVEGEMIAECRGRDRETGELLLVQSE